MGITLKKLLTEKGYTSVPLEAEASEIKAAGAGASGMETQVAAKNHLEIGGMSMHKLPLVLFDLTHVNEALAEFQTPPVHGIIGAEVLQKRKAVIDYAKKRLYLYWAPK